VSENEYIKAPELKPSKVQYNLSPLIDSANGNNEFIKKMINLFLTTSYASINNLKFHLNRKNNEQLEKTAHRMIGSYKQMGVVRIAALLKELESVATQNEHNGETRKLVNEIEKESEELFESLKKELNNH
jgi:HPt (histidine-containing phosphotransfer) domain-containing protein